MISPAKLSALIGDIYACTLNPAHWPEAMRAICRELDLSTGVISVISLEDGQPVLAAATGFEQPWLEKVFFYSQELLDIWGGEPTIRNLPLDEPAVLSDVNPSAITGETAHPFHVSFHQPQGIVDAIAVGLTRDGTSIGSIGFNRHRDFGLIGKREIEVMRLLLPHLQRAATITRVIDGHMSAAADFRSVLKSLSVPIMLVTADLRVLHTNDAATMLKQSQTAFTVQAGKIAFTSSFTQRALEFALHSTRISDAIPAGDPFGIPLGAGDEALRSLHILPLKREKLGPDGGECFALLFAPLTVSSESAGKAIAALFGLTEAERRVFEKIADGQTVQEAATKLDVAVSTVRTHLLRIFEKTGAARQAELVALARQFTAPVLQSSQIA
ncbi:MULTISPECIES: helix-turn-helix transcriptional regulator [Rhizobiaceae]|uniref:helix-turn-helix transcriptional regulator n=1 Tax=Rhizobiaceae TaxID=82115 RepID=UPI0024128C93|nr:MULTISPECIES: helix-turn-helix transcriptional regulator [Rhizobiaceae]MDG3580656.1 helix-turn-helix transcriptional regulator [Rhizobium sp. YJ-22]